MIEFFSQGSEFCAFSRFFLVRKRYRSKNVALSFKNQYVANRKFHIVRGSHDRSIRQIDGEEGRMYGIIFVAFLIIFPAQKKDPIRFGIRNPLGIGLFNDFDFLLLNGRKS